jgi:hypothetical protein
MDGFGVDLPLFFAGASTAGFNSIASHGGYYIIASWISADAFR